MLWNKVRRKKLGIKERRKQIFFKDFCFEAYILVSYGIDNRLPEIYPLKTNHSCYSFGSQKSEMVFAGLKSKYYQDWVPYGSSQGGSASLPFLVSKGYLNSFTSKPEEQTESLSYSITLTLLLL
jgi:hypothetical protein